VVKYADRIAYLAHDALDAIRAEVLDPSAIPTNVMAAFGEPGRDWVASMIKAVVDESYKQSEIVMEPSKLEAMLELRAFMFENVYLRPEVESQRRRAKEIIRDLVSYYLEHVDQLPYTYQHPEADDLTQVIDFVAGMTDRYAIRTHDELFRPRLF
jgi:dGTPase